MARRRKGNQTILRARIRYLVHTAGLTRNKAVGQALYEYRQGYLLRGKMLATGRLKSEVSEAAQREVFGQVEFLAAIRRYWTGAQP